jgi:hypothetical protein
VGYVFQPLANSFVYVGAGGDIEQTLMGFHILHNGFSLTLHCEHHGPLALLEVFHEFAGAAAKRRERLNVLVMSKHIKSLQPLRLPL